MSKGRNTAIWTLAAVALGIAVAGGVRTFARFGRENTLTGAVLMAHEDPRKQLPIPDVAITAEAAGVTAHTISSASGYFRLRWPEGVWRRERVSVWLRHAAYQPLEITLPLAGEMCIARMTRIPAAKTAA